MSKPNLKHVLESLNKARKAWGMKPLRRVPKGRPEKSCSCPIYNALPIRSVPGFRIRLFAKDLRNDDLINRLQDVGFHPHDLEPDCLGLPRILSDFMWFFDNNHYPELIK